MQKWSISSALPWLAVFIVAGLLAAGGFMACNRSPSTSVGAGGASSAPPKRAPQPLDLSFIPPEAIFALALNPDGVILNPDFTVVSSSLPSLIAADSGIDPTKLEQVIFIAGPGKQLTDFFFGTILHYKEPVDREELMYALSPRWEEVADGERPYHRATADGRCIYFKDGRTVVLAAEETMKKMLAAKSDADSPLLATLKKHDDSSAALGVLEVKAVRGQIGAFLLFSKPPAPLDAPPFNALVQLPKHVDEVVVKLDIDPETNLVALLRAKDEESAAAANGIINDVAEKFADTVEERIPDKPADPDAGIAAGGVAAAMQELATTFRTRLKREQEGDVVRLSLSRRGIIVPLTIAGPPMIRSFQQSWIQADAAQSLKNLERIGAALDAATAAKGEYPPLAIVGADSKPLLSWRVQLLPLLGEQALYDEFRLDEPWDSKHNKPLIRRMPNVYRVPGHPFDGKTHYQMATGAGTVYEATPKPSTITDDKADTILVVAVHEGKGIEWTKPGDYMLDRADPTAGLTYIGKDDFFALFADGQARSVSTKDKKSADVLKKFTPAGGDNASN